MMIESRLRTTQLGLAAFSFVGLFLELLLRDHYQVTVQYVPFGLISIGLIGVALVVLRPARWSIVALRIIGLTIGAGALVGILFHLRANVAFEREIVGDAPLGELLRFAIKGASPLLAPGALGLGGGLLVTATYRHPGLQGAAPGTTASPGADG
jgi:hypothetical protein